MAKFNKKKMIKKNRQRKYGSKKQYRQPILRTLQLATVRPSKAMLRFRKSLAYRVTPNLTSTGDEHIFWLQFRANSIYDICSQYYPTQTIHDKLWVEQSAINALVGTSTNPSFDADGYDDWKDRFQKSCVIGSKINVTYQPVEKREATTEIVNQTPTTLFLQKSLEADNGVDPSVHKVEDIVRLPYVSRSQITQSKSGRNGISAAVNGKFSAKKDFGVSNVSDVAGLKAGLDSSLTSAEKKPEKMAFYNIYLAPTIPAHPGEPEKFQMVEGIMRIYIDYIVMLTEATNTNKATVDAVAEGIPDPIRVSDEL